MATKSCRLDTSKGALTINLYSEIPNLCELFHGLVSTGAYSGCKFSRITQTHIWLEAPPKAALESSKYCVESHTLIGYGKRGTVSLMPDLSVVITTGTTTPPPSAVQGGSIIGVCSTESAFIVQEISSAAVVKGAPETPQFPVCVLAADHAENDAQKYSRSAATMHASSAAKKTLKNRIRMFEDPEDPPVVLRKFKRNPNLKEPADPLLERLKAYESRLENM